ncbi:efflux RND transporter permease subunit [Sandaracinus amylolyticus]|uniref:efflux RND transporter permease subunit n=1 Tax=Sandaracinus amylolyticus TaxID=927083 RepID=UPI001F3E871E|nr:efflux RND transporter permease subunit [Sandaracinus amylolyticus]UJR83646.1 Hypothetical protein I5071_57150 [Sandaracinus amylolyticus]
MSEFFVRRPVFAAVIAILTTLAGALSIPQLPVEQYPGLELPQVVVTAVYPGAAAQTVEETVTTPLEQAINGIAGLRTLQSTSTTDGVSQITVTVERERDLDLATVDVQNRVSTVLGRLPPEVRTIGVDVRRSSNAIVLGLGFHADESLYEPSFLSNFVDRYVREELQRIDGVGEVRIFGERRYAMRLWLDPTRLAARDMSPREVVDALREQNAQIAAGRVGRSPAPDSQTFEITVRALGRLETPEQFEDLVLRTDPDGTLVRLRDVGRAELGAESYDTLSRFEQRDALGLIVFQLPGSNALDVYDAVLEEMERLGSRFPPGVEWAIGYDPMTAVEESIDELVWTLGGSILLVVAVIFLFLQRWRTTLIPLLTIPVSLVGTFFFVQLAGFTINSLTLFGLTLATGLVVDDAIVVIENVERHARERKLGSRAATLSAVKEIFGAVVSVSLVLVAVFVPPAFFPGTTGILYQQFALTIAFSMALSAFNALTLAPALAALLVEGGGEAERGVFGAFNRSMHSITRAYERALELAMRRRWISVLALAALTAAGVVLYRSLPTGFVPNEDLGYFITLVQAPPGASFATTRGVVQQVENIFAEDPAIHHTFAGVGVSLEGTAPNRAVLWSMLRPRDERDDATLSADATVARVNAQLTEITGAVVRSFPPPPIRGLGNLGGVEYQLLDREGNGLNALANAASDLIGRATVRPELASAFTTFSASDPQLVVELDRERARSLDVPVSEAFGALQVYMGAAYVNDFDFAQRSYRVYVQADERFRMSPGDIGQYYARSTRGAAVPLAGLVSTSEATAPPVISHFDLYRSATVNAAPMPGRSSGEAIAALDEVSAQLPRGFEHAWSGLALEEREAGSQAGLLMALGILIAFLVMAAQYESFVVPVVILTAVPTAVVGALGAQAARGLANDVYCQVGLLMLVGLACKNAILICEFAQQLRAEHGRSLVRAAVEASVTRLRPILMTSLAFALGVVPLAIASGAGAASRHSLGTAVLGGMVASTVLNLALTPVMYVVVVGAFERVRARVTRLARSGDSVKGLSETAE